MKNGYLSQYFNGVAAKRLSLVEVDDKSSNQHEFNGVDGLKVLLGEPVGKTRYPAKFLYFSDSDEFPLVEDGFLTWYDARQKAREERSVMRWEYRLYFPSNQVLELARPDDLLLVAKMQNGSLLAIVVRSGSTIEMQLRWLFGLAGDLVDGFTVRDNLSAETDRLQFASRAILDSIGIEVEFSADNYLEEMLENFGHKFPSTAIFSSYARKTLSELSPAEDVDYVLMAWMEREEALFRSMERYLISERLNKGFEADVDEFISFSLSVQNRRKSRAGQALENHLEEIFKGLGVSYSRTAITENKSKPDFIFPGVRQYHDQDFHDGWLTMLGVKSSCKDRWRQVLSEAERIKKKHLFTLESAISVNQTDEMASKDLQLVLPKQLHLTYTNSQREWLMSLHDFTSLVLNKQIGFQ